MTDGPSCPQLESNLRGVSVDYVTTILDVVNVFQLKRSKNLTLRKV